ncbi:MAG: hypothetical protein AAB556_02420 [Patescibacteria group bacterium]
MKDGQESIYFDKAEQIAKDNSTCLKLNTGAVIVKNGEIVGMGWNMCSPGEGVFCHGDKVAECARMNLPSGQGYELCKPIHAEVMAVLSAGMENCKGATLFLSGHYYACWNCESTVRFAGVAEIKIRDKNAKEFYQKQQEKR